MDKIIRARYLTIQKSKNIFLDNEPINNDKSMSQPKNEIIQDDTGLPIYSGPYDYKIWLEGKAYPHSVNITKLKFIYKYNEQIFNKYFFISSGHSFAEPRYDTNLKFPIVKTNKINDLFIKSDNLFFSIDNDFNDLCIINFGKACIDKKNNINISNKSYEITSVCRNTNIKYLEDYILIKQGHNTGESMSRPIINFDTDKYLVSSNKSKTNFFTFKINGKIVLVSSKYNSGIISKGINSQINKFNGEPITHAKNMELLQYYYYMILKDFMSHELFQSYELDPGVKNYFESYVQTNSLTLNSLMGDSGSGFFRMKDNDLEFVGINIGGCSLIVLNEIPEPRLNYNFIQRSIPSNKIHWDGKVGKLRVGKYIIEEIHKASQILPIDKIERLISNELAKEIQLKEITV
jgi:hypothetical protein